jgi:hypothetical protein
LLGAYLKFVEFKIGIPAATTLITFKGRAIICTQIRRVAVRILLDGLTMLEF